MKTLQQGGKLRIVMLGDSICNDTSNSLYETLLLRAYPKARIEVVTSVRGGTGCLFYKDPPNVQEHVLRFHPDLVIIAGISHGYDPEAIRSVIRQIKKASSSEILVLTGAIAPAEWCRKNYLKDVPLLQGLENFEKFTPRLRRVTDEENVEFLDMRGLGRVSPLLAAPVRVVSSRYHSRQFARQAGSRTNTAEVLRASLILCEL